MTPSDALLSHGGQNPLKGFTKSNCENCDLIARSRLPTL
jgi:hypothetical protein